MATAGNERRSFGVFWDIENCRVPKGGSARELVGRIRRRLYSTETDREAEFMCVCDASKENKELMKELNSAQVTIVHVDATNKNAADEKLRQRMRYFVETHKPPATVVLISGDVNFEGLLSDIQHRNQLDTILIHPDRINEGLRQCVQQRHAYSDFTSKLPSRQIPSKSTEHDCVILGLPCGRDSKAISARLHQLSENCGGKVLSVVPPRARIRFKDLEFAERAGCRMNGEDVFGTKIRVEIAPKPVADHFNSHQSPRAKSGKKKFRKKRGPKSDYHSSDGSGNSPQSSPQGSPKSSPYRQRSPGHPQYIKQLSNEGGQSQLGSPQRTAKPQKSYHDLHDPFDEVETVTVVTDSAGDKVEPPVILSGPFHQQCRQPKSAPAKVLPISQQQCHNASCSLLDDGDSEMEGLPWNQQQHHKKVHQMSNSTQCTEQLTQRTSVPTATRERHSSYTPNFVYKKHNLPPRHRTFSDPPLPQNMRTVNDNPTRGGNYRHSSQPNSPFRDHRNQGFRGNGNRGGGPNRRFSRSPSNSSNRSNQSSPSFSDSGERFSADTATSDVPVPQASFLCGSTSSSATSFSPRTGSTGAHNGLTPGNSPCRQQFSNTPVGDFYLQVTNLDNSVPIRELKEQLKKAFQRQAKIEDISIQHQEDDNLLAIVRVTTLKAAERAATKLHRATKIGCKRIHVYLKQQPATNNRLRVNVVDLLKEFPSHSLKWFKFVDLYEKRYKGRITLLEIEQLGGEILLLNDEQSGHSVQLVRHTSRARPDIKKPLALHLDQQLTSSAFSPPCKSSGISSFSKSRPIAMPGQVQNEPRPEQQANAPSDLCYIHCPQNHEKTMESEDVHCLPCVRVHRKTFAAQVHTLLLNHNGSMPLKSFMVCYLAEFPPLAPGEIPLDYLISTIPGVQITKPDALNRNVRWAANPSHVAVVHMPPQLSTFASEVLEVLSSVPQCMLNLSEFLIKYQETYGRPCCFSDYGHASLHSLLNTLPGVVQAFGWGSSLIVTLTHQVQLMRFLSDLLTILRQQSQWQVAIDQLPNAFCNTFRKAFNISNYGACYTEDLITDLPGNAILVSTKDGVQMLQLTRQEVLLDLEWRVSSTLKEHPQGVALPVFLSSYHKQHGTNLNLADYNVTSVRELIQLLPESVMIERKSGRDVIRLMQDSDQHLKTTCARQVLTAFPDQKLSTYEFVQRYQMFYGETVKEDQLRSVLQDLAEVTCDKDGTQTIHVMAGAKGVGGDSVVKPLPTMNNVLPAIRDMLNGSCSVKSQSSSKSPSEDISDLCGNTSLELQIATQHLKSISTDSAAPATTIDNPSTYKISEKMHEDLDTSEHSCSALNQSDIALNNCMSSEDLSEPTSSVKMQNDHHATPCSTASSLMKAGQPMELTSTQTGSSSPHSTANPSGGKSCSRVASSRPASRTASNSSGSPLGSPLSYPGTPRRNRLAARFTNPVIPVFSPPTQNSDSDNC